MELQDDVEDESDPTKSKNPRRRIGQASKTPAADKGKGKASSAPGPLPEEAREEAQEFGRQVMEAADQIADRWSTSRRSILVAASLMLRETRAPNAANKHAEWYAYNFPKQDGGQYFSVFRSQSFSLLCSVSRILSACYSGGLQTKDCRENRRGEDKEPQGDLGLGGQSQHRNG